VTAALTHIGRRQVPSGRAVPKKRARIVVWGRGATRRSAWSGAAVCTAVRRGRRDAGLLELSASYVGCDVQSSALCMDKPCVLVARTRGSQRPTSGPSRRTGHRCDRLGLSRLRQAGRRAPLRLSKVSQRQRARAVETARQYDSKWWDREASRQRGRMRRLGNDLDC